jgi:integrase
MTYEEKITELDKFFRWLKFSDISDRSIEIYFDIMKDFFNHFHEFNMKTVEEFLIMCRDVRKYEPNTYNQRLNGLKKFANFKGMDILIDFRHIKQKKISIKPSEFVTPKELHEKIFPAIRNIYINKAPRYIAAFMFLFETGLRISELVSIKLSDLDLENRCCKIYAQKTKEYRYVYFSENCKNIILFHVNYTRVKLDEPLFKITIKGTVHLLNKINEVCKFENCTKLHPHIFRHSTAQFIMDNTGDIQLVMKLLGHKCIQSTFRYTLKNDKQAKDAHEKLFSSKKYH